VEDCSRSVRQEIASLGGSDPSTDANGDLNRRICTLLKSHANEDPPAERVKPVPIQLVAHAAVAAHNAADELTRALSDCAVTGFFFLLRPGGHTHSHADNHPFRLQDASLCCALAWHNAAAADLQLLQNATQVPLNFLTTQKMKPSPMAPQIRSLFPQSKQCGGESLTFDLGGLPQQLHCTQSAFRLLKLGK
jgi:hypothetical protein